MALVSVKKDVALSSATYNRTIFLQGATTYQVSPGHFGVVKAFSAATSGAVSFNGTVGLFGTYGTYFSTAVFSEFRIPEATVVTVQANVYLVIEEYRNV